MFQEYIINRIENESSTIKSFYLSPKNGNRLPVFAAGQFVNIKVKLPKSDKELIRSYTLSDSPKKAYVRLTIKRELEGKVSRYLHDSTNVGDVILVSNPMGNFSVSNQKNNPLVLISGGVGITPMLSIAEYCAKFQPYREIHFLHSSKNEDTQPMFKRLTQLREASTNFHLSIFHSTPLVYEKINLHYDYQGYITKNNIPFDELADYFICGPNSFMENMFSHLKDLKIENDKIHYEFFGVEKKIFSVKNDTAYKVDNFTINLINSNKLILWDNRMNNLLELLESEGFSPNNSCRMGTCLTCETKLKEGVFEYDPEPFVETSEEAVLLCCAKPTSNITLEL